MLIASRRLPERAPALFNASSATTSRAISAGPNAAAPDKPNTQLAITATNLKTVSLMLVLTTTGTNRKGSSQATTRPSTFNPPRQTILPVKATAEI